MMVQTLSRDASLYGEREVLFSTKRYHNGKMEETEYYRGDCIELSDSAITRTVLPEGSENYNSIVGKMRCMPAIPQNKMFYETMEVMTDFYEGKLAKEAVRDIYKSYCYSFWGKPDDRMGMAWRSRVSQGLSEMNEYFSRANTRAANAANLWEGEAVCEEMQDMFRCVSDELAEEYGSANVDFSYVEEHTVFRLDGGITYKGVRDYLHSYF